MSLRSLLLREAPPVGERSFFDVAHDGEVYRIFLRRSGAARRFTLRVRTGARDVVLTVPARASLKDARAFAERHAPWVGARLRRLPEAIPFEPGSLIPLRGVWHRIVLQPPPRGAGAVAAAAPAKAGEEPLLLVGGEGAFAARRVRDFLIKEARRDLEACVVRHAARLDVKVRRITLRDTTSRWGSCSSAGALNFSWRLILPPPFVLDYLAAHEVAHLVHMNHSDAFWAVVERIYPEAAAAEAWLRRNGSGLLRFGAQTQNARP
ncbi:M48 family metallopeptidase [Methylocella silvestris]|uniref:Metal-dependent hydrolase n=1 Tax=Methylocella silvestris TaxID=199596 RepID=A0A2J7TJF6_METSI|nr:SprT family zinc-dependent metalloprotease [Methylocella silvestris]PNG26899.1 metal-dependent hydrolase [Methylocella silvestris]